MNEPVSVYVDTGAFYARYDDADQHHAQAVDTFQAIHDGEIPVRTLFTTSHVLSELGGMAVKRKNAAAAARILREVQSSPRVEVVYPDTDDVDTAIDHLEQYDDQAITPVDHLGGVIAEQRGIDHVFTFDGDFRTLGFTLIPGDIQPP